MRVGQAFLPSPRITAHAIARYRERVACIPDEQVLSALSRDIIRRAIAFGARYVRLGTGQRIVLDGATVVTVLPCGARGQRLKLNPDDACNPSRSRPCKSGRMASPDHHRSDNGR